MYLIHNGKSCVMVWDVNRGKYVYITEKRWDKMTKEQKSEYKHAPFCDCTLADSELLHPMK